MDFFDFEFDFQDCLKATLAGIFLLGSVQLHAVMADQGPDEPTDRPPHAQNNVPGHAPRYDSDAPAQADEHAADMLNQRDDMKTKDRARKGDKTLERAEKVTGENHPKEHKDKGTTPGQ